MTTDQPTVERLITLAEGILDGTVPVPAGRAPRAAAVVARQCLEQSVTNRCDRLVPGLQRPTMRSQLILLTELDDRGIGKQALTAWDRLSQACHHHGYELQPTAGEVRYCLDLIKDIARHCDSA